MYWQPLPKPLKKERYMNEYEPKKPFVVSINGVPKIGASYVCETLYQSLKHMGHSAMVLDLGSPSKVMQFDDDYWMNKYAKTDVIILDRHPYVTKAFNQRRKTSLFNGVVLSPDMAVLLTAKPAAYAHRVGADRVDNQLCERLFAHQNMLPCMYGVDDVLTLDTSGIHGLLYATGVIKRELIKKWSEGDLG